ncbi:START domain-containing protein 10-like isoform X1 [Melanerpes formicivorus]|uniref:START domain-containing protein 10-like isoform X1 n=1 Tax=Melanerpes formicivorus TaxID=211600 RepID=UPI00358E7EEF
MSRAGEMVYIPDDSDFSSFRAQCESPEGWHCRYNKAGITVWSQGQEESCTVQKIKTRLCCKDVAAETLYDVLHDSHYRSKWDSNMIETHDIGRLTVNADVGYYSWKCPSPLKNRDFVTLRSWLPLDDDFIILNYSVKHPKYPPRKDFVRAVSLQTGYLVKANGARGCVLYYLTQVDPRGSLPKWVVNRVSQFVAPKAVPKLCLSCARGAVPAGHEEAAPGGAAVPGVEAPAPAWLQALGVPRAELPAQPQPGRALPAARRLPGAPGRGRAARGAPGHR